MVPPKFYQEHVIRIGKYTATAFENVPSLFHSSGFTNLFSNGYVWVSVKSMLDNIFSQPRVAAFRVRLGMQQLKQRHQFILIFQYL